MFTLGLFYVFIYVLIFVSLLILSFTTLPIYFLTHYSTTNYLIILQKYSVFKTIFLFLLFTLTGLPPVGLFFIKFNILVFILYQTNIFVLFILFLMFFCNMLYYIQLFNVKNYKKNIYSILNNEIFYIFNNNLNNNLNKTTYSYFNFLFWIISFLGFLFILLFVYSDIFFIFKL